MLVCALSRLRTRLIPLHAVSRLRPVLLALGQVGVYNGVWEHKKPREGTELNKHAQVTILRVFPEGASAGLPADSRVIAEFENDLRAYSRCVISLRCLSV